MQLGRVIGSVWASVKDARLEGQRLLFVQPLNAQLENAGSPIICTDCTGAGANELVYWCGGRESSFAFLPQEVVTDRTVVAIVDEIHIKES